MKLFDRLIVSAGERQTAEIQLLLQKERSQRMLRHNCQLLKSISLTVLLFVFNSILFHICHFPFFYILLCFIIGQIRELLKRNNLLVFLFAQSCSTGPFFTFLFYFLLFFITVQCTELLKSISLPAVFLLLARSCSSSPPWLFFFCRQLILQC